MIQTVYHGRFGNNLYSFLLSHLLANEFNLNMLPYDGQYSHLIDMNFKSDGRILNNFIHIIDENIEECLNFLRGGDNSLAIRLDGYFQKSKYFIPYREQIKSWIKYKDPIDFVPEKNSIILHVRRSDFGFNFNSGFLKLSYYTNILESLPSFDKVYIVGGCSCNNSNHKCIDETVIKTFEKYNPIYPNLDAITEFQMIQKFNTVIESNSTFCWWSTFLSDRAETIYSPKTINGGYRDTDDLDIPNDSRYIYVKTEIEKY